MRILLRLLVALVLAASLPCAALEVRPLSGTYRLSWTTVASDRPVTRYITLNQKKLAIKTVSSRPLSCTAGPFRLVVDESDGTGTGYNTAYLIPLSIYDSHTGLSKASRLQLVADAKSPVWSRGDQITSDQPVTAAKGSPKVSGILEELRITSVSSRKPSYTAVVTLRGAWRGTIRLAKGSTGVETIDGNANGIYGERAARDPSDPQTVKTADAILIGSETSALGKATMAANRLYSVAVSPEGNVLKIFPYSGPTGRLAVDAVDASGRKAVCAEVIAASDAGVFRARNSDSIPLPTGSYSGTTVTVSASSAGRSATVTLQSGSSLRIASGRTTKAAFGGPLSMDIVPYDGTMDVQPGRTKPLVVRFTARGGAQTARPERAPAITVQNGAGKILLTDRAVSAGDSLPWVYRFQMPPGWPPGDYLVTAVSELEPYQKTLRVTRTIRAVKQAAN